MKIHLTLQNDTVSFKMMDLRDGGPIAAINIFFQKAPNEDFLI